MDELPPLVSLQPKLKAAKVQEPRKPRLRIIDDDDDDEPAMALDDDILSDIEDAPPLSTDEQAITPPPSPKTTISPFAVKPQPHPDTVAVNLLLEPSEDTPTSEQAILTSPPQEWPELAGAVNITAIFARLVANASFAQSNNTTTCMLPQATLKQLLLQAFYPEQALPASDSYCGNLVNALVHTPLTNPRNVPIVVQCLRRHLILPTHCPDFNLSATTFACLLLLYRLPTTVVDRRTAIRLLTTLFKLHPTVHAAVPKALATHLYFGRTLVHNLRRNMQSSLDGLATATFNHAGVKSLEGASHYDFDLELLQLLCFHPTLLACMQEPLTGCAGLVDLCLDMLSQHQRSKPALQMVLILSHFDKTIRQKVYALFVRLLSAPPNGPLASLNTMLRLYTDTTASIFHPRLGYRCSACRQELHALVGQGLNPMFPFAADHQGISITASHDGSLEVDEMESLLDFLLLELSKTLNSLLADLPSYEQSLLVTKASIQIASLNKSFPSHTATALPATTLSELVRHAVHPAQKHFGTAQLLLELVECHALKATVLSSLSSPEVVDHLKLRLACVWTQRQKSGAAVVALACHLAACGVLDMSQQHSLFVACKAACTRTAINFTGTMLVYFGHYNRQWRETVERTFTAYIQDGNDINQLVTQMIPCEDCQDWLRQYKLAPVAVDVRCQAHHDVEVLEL
eukprot:m.180980 g.180980  ORF g.180980 m.180980 type:complete len:688 (+) comp16868_c0_seq4:999-3062(+)